MADICFKGYKTRREKTGLEKMSVDCRKQLLHITSTQLCTESLFLSFTEINFISHYRLYKINFSVP